MASMVVLWGHGNKLLQMWGLRMMKFMLSQFWRPEIQNQDVGSTPLSL